MCIYVKPHVDSKTNVVEPGVAKPKVLDVWEIHFFTKTNNIQDALINLPRCFILIFLLIIKKMKMPRYEATNVVFIIIIDISDNGYEQRKSFL